MLKSPTLIILSLTGAFILESIVAKWVTLGAIPFPLTIVTLNLLFWNLTWGKNLWLAILTGLTFESFSVTPAGTYIASFIISSGLNFFLRNLSLHPYHFITQSAFISAAVLATLNILPISAFALSYAGKYQFALSLDYLIGIFVSSLVWAGATFLILTLTLRTALGNKTSIRI